MAALVVMAAGTHRDTIGCAHRGRRRWYSFDLTFAIVLAFEQISQVWDVQLYNIQGNRTHAGLLLRVLTWQTRMMHFLKCACKSHCSTAAATLVRRDPFRICDGQHHTAQCDRQSNFYHWAHFVVFQVQSSPFTKWSCKPHFSCVRSQMHNLFHWIMA